MFSAGLFGTTLPWWAVAANNPWRAQPQLVVRPQTTSVYAKLKPIWYNVSLNPKRAVWEKPTASWNRKS